MLKSFLRLQVIMFCDDHHPYRDASLYPFVMGVLGDDVLMLNIFSKLIVALHTTVANLVAIEVLQSRAIDTRNLAWPLPKR